MAKASIYTRKGDFGETGIWSGKRFPKSDTLIEAIGSIDELNATIGVVIESLSRQSKEKLEQVQRDLFGIGAQLAGYQGTESRAQGLERRVEEMEEEIDKMWGKMPPLRNFILPRGQLHLARTVCRRVERSVIKAIKQLPSNSIKMSILKYTNRLSDYLFCLARWENFRKRKKEVVWK